MPKGDHADDILVKQAQQGNLQAFNDLVLRYQNMIYNHSLRLMGDEATAGDLTQDAFIKAYRALPGFRGQHFRAWLFRIAGNLCYDEMRRQKRRPTQYLDDLRSDDSADAVEIPSTAETPEEHLQRIELQQAIQHCISMLKPAQRSVLVLCDVQGYNYLQTAEIAALPVGTVKSRLSRARLAMRDCLRGFAELLPEKYRL